MATAAVPGVGRLVLPALVALAVVPGLWWWLADGAPDESGGAVLRAPAVVTPEDARIAPAPGIAPTSVSAPVTAIEVPAPDVPPSPDEVLAAALASAEHVLTGRIVRPDGTPVAGVAVAAGADAEELVATCTAAGWIEHRIPPDQELTSLPRSDAQGRFQYSLTSRSRVLVVAFDLPPCDRQVLVLTDVEPGHFDAGDLVLEDAAAVRGRIVDPDGNPVPGADVLAQTDANRRHTNQEGRDAQWQLRYARTGEDGRFLLRGLLDERSDIEVSTRDWEDLHLDALEVTPGAVRDLGDLVLSRGAALGGVLRGPAGEPLGRRWVSARIEARLGVEDGSSEERSGVTSGAGLTDAEGRFVISGLVPGVYSVHASGRDLAMGRLYGIPTGSLDLVLDLTPGGRALIEVRSAITGEPLTDAVIESSRPASAGDIPWRGGGLPVVAADVSGLSPGTYVLEHVDLVGADVWVEAPGHIGQALVIPGLADGVSPTVSVSLERSLVFAGHVVDHQDRPLADASLTLSPDDEQTHDLRPAAGLSGADGSFGLTGLAPGRWQVLAEREGYVRAGPAPRVLANTDVQDFLVRLYPAGRVEGQVLLPSGAPAPDIQVTALQLEHHGWPALAGTARADALVSEPGPLSGAASVTADVEGRFVLPTLTPGEYLVTSSRESAEVVLAQLDALAPVDDTRPDMRSLTGPLTEPQASGVALLFVPSGQTTQVTLTLPVPGRIFGRISVGGHAAAAQVVALKPSGDSWVPVQAVESDRGGNYTLADLGPGEYAVIAGVVGEALPRARVLSLAQGEGARVDLDFAGVALLVLVRDLDTQRPVPGVPLRIIRLVQGSTTIECAFGVGWQVYWNMTQRGPAFAGPVTTDSDGLVRIPNLLPGRYYAQLESDTWAASTSRQRIVDETWSPDPLVVEVRQLASLEVSAFNRANGYTLSGLTVKVEPQPEPGKPAGGSSASVLYEGVAEFTWLMPGRHQVRLEDEQGTVLATETVQLAPGETRRLSFRIDA